MFKTMKIWMWVALVIVVIFVIVLAIRLFSGDEDTWLCQNGQWVKHGNPSKLMPTQTCGSKANTGLANPASVYCGEHGGKLKIKKDISGNESGICVFSDDTRCEEWKYFRGECQSGANIHIINIKNGQEVNLPFVVEGEARVFESVVNVALKDSKGQILYQANVMAQSPDMGQFGPFFKEIDFLTKLPADDNAILEVYSLSAKDGAVINLVSIPVVLKLPETTTVKLFFNNNKLDPAISCNKVFSVERIIAKTIAPARKTLELLLGGVMPIESKKGFYSNLNPDVKIQELTIANGVAKVDFDKTLEQGVGGSCRVAAIRAQIAQTLKQFSSVKDVIISIDRRTEDILQP